MEGGGMHFVRIGGRAINMDNVLHAEEQRWHDTVTVKLYFVGQPGTPMVLSDQEAKDLAAYLDYVAEAPAIAR
jgi:hypothetical protein